MRFLLSIMIVITFLMSTDLWAEVHANPTGLWQTFDEAGRLQSTVSVEIKDEKLFGYVRSLHQQPEENPVCEACEGAWRGKPVIGMEVINGLTLKKGVWQKGTIFDPESGKSYRGSVWLEGETLAVRGHVGFFYQTRSWQRLPKQSASEQGAMAPQSMPDTHAAGSSGSNQKIMIQKENQ
jgi:uncharacterized protein (DUF2147 family)